jgi:hypothetical protein
VFVAVRYKALDHEAYPYERDTKSVFSKMARTNKTRLHCDEINDKLQKKKLRTNILLLIKDLFPLYCVIICVFEMFQNKSLLRIFYSKFFISRCSTDKKKFSFSAYDWRYLLTDSSHGNYILLMKSGNKYKVTGTN